MTSFILSLFITMIFFISPVWGVHPNILVPTTNATCQPEYEWMNNAEQNNPCLAVAYVIAACVAWTQPALPSGYSYNSPNGTTATPCYCSWACYNLMMACTLCQNPAYMSEIKTWPAFSQECPSSYKNQMFPQGYVLAGNASIPYWATINPANWSSELFDVGQAGEYANQNKSDYWPSTALASPSPSPSSTSSSSRSSVNTGAIIGGVVGSVVVLLLIFIRCYIVYKRRNYRRLHNVDGATPTPYTGIPMTDIHARWSEDVSKAFSSPPPDPSRASFLNTQPQGMDAGMATFVQPSYSSPPLGSPRTSFPMQPQGMDAGMTTPFPPLYSSAPPMSPPPVDTASFLTTENPPGQRSHAIPMV